MTRHTYYQFNVVELSSKCQDQDLLTLDHEFLQIVCMVFFFCLFLFVFTKLDKKQRLGLKKDFMVFSLDLDSSFDSILDLTWTLVFHRMLRLKWI